MRQVQAGSSVRHLCFLAGATLECGWRRRRRRGTLLPVAVLLGALLAAACSQVQEPAGVPAVAEVQADRSVAVLRPRAFILPGVETALPSPEKLAEDSWRQLVTFEHEGEEQMLLALLEVHDGVLSLAVLQPVGIRLFSGVYRDGEIFLEKNAAFGAPGREPPLNQIFLDILLCLCAPGDWELPEGFVLEDLSDEVRQLVDPEGRIVYKIAFAFRQGRRMLLCIQQQIFAYTMAFHYLE